MQILPGLGFFPGFYYAVLSRCTRFLMIMMAGYRFYTLGKSW